MDSHSLSDRATFLYLQKLLCNFEDLRVQEKFCDIIIDCGGKEYKAHRALLACASQYFATMFNAEFIESNLVDGICHVNISEFKPNIVEVLLQFIYSGKLASFSKFGDTSVFCETRIYNNSDIAYITELFRALIYFQISEPLIDEFRENIKHLFTQILSRKKYEEAIYLFNQICAVDDDVTLVTELSEVIKQNLEAFIRSGSFAKIESSEVVTNLFKHHDFMINNEIIALKAFLSWIASNPVNRLQNLYEILDTINFTAIKKDDLDSLIFSAGLFTNMPNLYEEARDVFQKVEATLSGKLDVCGGLLPLVDTNTTEELIVMCVNKCSCGWNAHQTSTYHSKIYNTITGLCQNIHLPELHPLHSNNPGSLDFKPAKHFLLLNPISKDSVYHFRNVTGDISKLSFNSHKWDHTTCSCTTHCPGGVRHGMPSIWNGILSILTHENKDDLVNFDKFKCIKFVASIINESSKLTEFVVVYERYVNGINLCDFVAVLKIDSSGIIKASPDTVCGEYSLFDENDPIKKPAKYALYKTSFVHPWLFIVRNRRILAACHDHDTGTFSSMQTVLIDKDMIPSEVGAVIMRGPTLYLIGGKDNDGLPLNCVFCFDTTKVVLSNHVAMKYPRSNCCAVIVNGELCVLGGYQDKYGYTPVECYNETKKEWILVNHIKFDAETDTCAAIPINSFQKKVMP